jgi:SH3 domain protein
VKRPALIHIVWLLSAPAAFAETLYVTDQVTVGLRADVTPSAAVLGTISTGAAVEVLERNGALVRVRDANGVEGWAEATALAPQPPAAQQLRSLRAELDRTRAQLGVVQGQLDKARVAPAGDADKISAELAGTRAQLAKNQAEIKKKDEEIVAAVAARDTAIKEAATLRAALASEAAREPTAAAPEMALQATESAEESGFSFLWLGIAFAMLVLGFIGGTVWVKESIRRRMGGMYLRV